MQSWILFTGLANAFYRYWGAEFEDWMTATKRFLHLALVLLALAAVCLPSARAQVLDLEAQRQFLTSIAVDWRTHPGDDPGWAKPDYDDSGWKLIQPSSDWVAQGYAEQGGIAWFRFRLRAPARMASLVIQMPRIDRSYQLFANGRLITQQGRLPPDRTRTIINTAQVFTLPLHPGRGPQEVTLALRLWQSPQMVGIGANRLLGRAYAGDAATVLRQFALGKAATLLSRGTQYTEVIVVLIVGAASLLLFWFNREGFYLWFALNMLLAACDLPMHLVSQHFGWDYLILLYAYTVLDFLGCLTLAMFVLGALRVRGWRVILLASALCLCAELGPVLFIAAKLPLIWADGVYFLFNAALDVLLFWSMVRAWRQGMVVAKLLLVPYLVSALTSGTDNLGHWLVDWNVPHAESLLPTRIELLREPFAVSLNDVGIMVSLLGLLAVLVYRFAETSREEQRLASALQAAHDIQHRLVPVDIPRLGGLHAEIVYLAAEEVGGDFCQVLPRADGSVLIAIGDVSGKGLQAAMLGTLAVGALRSIAEEDVEPVEVLERLNHVVLQTDHAGFITCLCLKLTEDGVVTMANAGHLCPYINGEEMELEAGLPLGIVPDAEYQQATVLLPSVARMTLLSDGVVEARSRSGELFGFERTSKISQQPAAAIAAAAHRHGQEDDITVITLDWRLSAAALQPA